MNKMRFLHSLLMAAIVQTKARPRAFIEHENGLTFGDGYR